MTVQAMRRPPEERILSLRGQEQVTNPNYTTATDNVNAPHSLT